MTGAVRAALLTCLVLVSAGAAQEPTTVDGILADAWENAGLRPGFCDDRSFLRRASLDIIGRIPTVAELEAFLADPDPVKAVDRLLASPEFPAFWAELWTAMLNGYDRYGDRGRLVSWLRQRFADGAGHDAIATDLVTADPSFRSSGPGLFLQRNREDPAVKVSQVFLGIRLDCARCHDHPFDVWTQQDFLDMNRFFEVEEDDLFGPGFAGEAETAKRPRFLTGARPVTRKWRDELALHMRRSDAFARNFANRLWYHFMGRGIVHPPDDFNRKHVPSVPSLLDHLAAEAERTRWDFKAMIRLIATSRAYRVASSGGAVGERAEKLFARRVLKPLLPEQTFDSLVVAAARPAMERADFIAAFTASTVDADYTNAYEYREGVQQAMRRLGLVHRPRPATVEEMFLRTLSRRPTARELALVRAASPSELVHALVNSSEFLWNH